MMISNVDRWIYKDSVKMVIVAYEYKLCFGNESYSKGGWGDPPEEGSSRPFEGDVKEIHFIDGLETNVRIIEPCDFTRG